jgi:hypothetical protein
VSFDELIPIGADELIPIGVDELIPLDVLDLCSRPEKRCLKLRISQNEILDSKFDDFGPIYLMVISKQIFKLLVKHSKYGRKLAGLV